MYDEERPYIEQRPDYNPERRRASWDMGEGLQAVDGLRTSRYMQGQAERYVAGELSAYDLAREAESHYQEHDEGAREADLVASRITALVDSSSGIRFSLSGRQLCIIHGTLFRDVLPRDWTGTYRNVDITKQEPVLGGRSVMYSPAIEISMAIDYDMAQETAAGFYDAREPSGLARFTSFVAGLWQIHPFREGNTRTTAVFSQLYLRSMGIDADNEPFRANSLYYRDALVRASVTAPGEGGPDMTFIDAFYDSVINGSTFTFDVDMNVHGVRTDDTPYRDVQDYYPRQHR